MEDWRPTFEARRERWSLIACAALAIVFFIVFTLLYAQKTRTFNPTMFDMLDLDWTYWSVLNQGFAESLRQVPMRAFFFINEATVFLGLPLFAISAEPQMLAPLNAAAVAISIILLFLLVRRRTGSGPLGLAAAAALALNPQVESWVLLGFRPPLWGLPFLLAFWLLAERGNRFSAIVFLVLANLSKSNIAMANLFLGLLLLIFRPRHAWARVILFTSLACIAVIVAANLGMQRLLGVFPNAEMLHLQAYGDTMGSAFRNMLSDPGVMLGNVLYPGNLKHLLLLVPFALIPLLGGRYLLALLPELGLMLLTTRALHEQVTYRNMSETFPLVWLTNNNYAYILPHLTLAFAVGLAAFWGWAKAHKPGAARWIAPGLIAFSLLVGLLWPPQIGGPRPVSLHFNLGYYRVTEHDRTIKRVAEMMFADKSLAVKDNLICSETANRGFVTHFEYPNPNVSQHYVFVDLFSYTHLTTRRAFLDKVHNALASGKYGVLAFDDGVLLLSREADKAGAADVLAWMDEPHTRELLLTNRFPALARGPLVRNEMKVRVYSETQIPSIDPF